jgi:hypothetical protein
MRNRNYLSTTPETVLADIEYRVTQRAEYVASATEALTDGNDELAGQHFKLCAWISEEIVRLHERRIKFDVEI